MVVASLAGSTALKAITDTTTMAEKDCLLVVTELDISASFDLMWFRIPLDVCKTLEKIFVYLLACFRIFHEFLSYF